MTRPLPASARAVYDLLERNGGIDAAHALLYTRDLRALQRAGLAVLHVDGSYTAVRSTAVTAAPAAPGAVHTEGPEPMGTLGVRLPMALIEALEARPEGKSKAARAILEEALAAEKARQKKSRNRK